MDVLMKKMRARMYSPVLPVSALIRNWKLILVFCMFAVGLIAGALLMKGEYTGLDDLADNLFESYYMGRQQSGFLSILWLSFLSGFPFFVTAFIAGVSAVGTPVAVLTPLIRGLGYGIITGFLYGDHGLKGVGFCALLIVPQALISTVALLLACREALGFSIVFFTMLTPKSRPYQMFGDFKLYCARFGVLLIILLLSALTDALMSSAFLRFFRF